MSNHSFFPRQINLGFSENEVLYKKHSMVATHLSANGGCEESLRGFMVALPSQKTSHNENYVQL
jgi:hypothetical protein